MTFEETQDRRGFGLGGARKLRQREGVNFRVRQDDSAAQFYVKRRGPHERLIVRLALPVHVLNVDTDVVAAGGVPERLEALFRQLAGGPEESQVLGQIGTDLRLGDLRRNGLEFLKGPGEVAEGGPAGGAFPGFQVERSVFGRDGGGRRRRGRRSFDLRGGRGDRPFEVLPKPIRFPAADAFADAVDAGRIAGPPGGDGLFAQRGVEGAERLFDPAEALRDSPVPRRVRVSAAHRRQKVERGTVLFLVGQCADLPVDFLEFPAEGGSRRG
jgi:hypothetical protein